MRVKSLVCLLGVFLLIAPLALSHELTPKIWTGGNGALNRIFSTGGLWYNATCYEETRSGIQG